jgi:hypothetical protein
MVEGRSGTSFLFEAAEMVRNVAGGRANQLEGDIPSEPFVACAKDLSHAPCADLLEHPVVPD